MENTRLLDLLVTANSLRDKGHVQESLQFYDKALKLEENNATVLKEKGLTLRKLGNYEESIKCYEKAILNENTNSDLYNSLGYTYYSLGKYDEAINNYDKAIDNDHLHAIAYHNKGFTLNRQGKYQLAIDAFDKALHIDPKYTYAYNNKGSALSNLKRYSEAIECFNKAIELDPNLTAAHLNKASALCNQEKYNDAIKCYNTSITLDEKNAYAYNHKGIAYHKLKDYENAIKFYDLALEKDANYFMAAVNKAATLNSQGKYKEAIDLCEKVIKSNAYIPNVYHTKALAHENLGELNEAKICYDKMLEIDKNNLFAQGQKKKISDKMSRNNSINNSNINSDKISVENLPQMFSMTIDIRSDKSDSKEEEDNFKPNISKSQIKMTKEIGSGSFGRVYLAEYELTSVAVKLFNVLHFEQEKMLKITKNEIELLNKAKHPNLIYYFGSYEDPETNSIGIVTEFCQGGDLYSLIFKKGVKLTRKQKIKILLDVAAGMYYLHNMNLIHRDLKSGNILLVDDRVDITFNSVAKIADFGLSKIINQSASRMTMTNRAGTLYSSAPEVLESNKYGLKADVYSFGILMWEIFAEKIPYLELNLTEMQFMMKVCHANLRPSSDLLPKDLSEEISNMISLCLDADQEKRPTFLEIHSKLLLEMNL